MSFWDNFTIGKGPAKDNNNLNQPVNNVSEIQNPNNYNQTQMVTDAPIENTETDYDHMISNITTQYDTTPEILEDVMNKISFHETGHNQRYDEDAIQELTGGGQGEGRGLFQFEKRMQDDQGQYGQAAGLTARNRLKNWYKWNQMDVPDWLFQNNMTDPTVGFDASQLTREQQKMLFMADIAMGKGRTFEGIENLPSWWSKYHHVGGGKTGDFEHSMSKYETPEEVEMKKNVTNPVHQQAFTP